MLKVFFIHVFYGLAITLIALSYYLYDQNYQKMHECHEQKK